MAIRPSVPEIITVNSEDLQSQVRDLLPSQNGFGSELQATNVITPIIDLTQAAQGSNISEQLQTALNFGGATVIALTPGNSAVVANSPGFYRLTVFVGSDPDAGGGALTNFTMSDGLSTKNVLAILSGGAQVNNMINEVDKVFWLSSGESLTVDASAKSYVFGSIRQIADSEGKFVNPSGFPL